MYFPENNRTVHYYYYIIIIIVVVVVVVVIIIIIIIIIITIQLMGYSTNASVETVYFHQQLMVFSFLAAAVTSL